MLSGRGTNGLCTPGLTYWMSSKSVEVDMTGGSFSMGSLSVLPPTVYRTKRSYGLHQSAIIDWHRAEPRCVRCLVLAGGISPIRDACRCSVFMTTEQLSQGFTV